MVEIRNRRNDGKINMTQLRKVKSNFVLEEELEEVAKLNNDRNSELNRTLWYNNCGYSQRKKGAQREKEKKN